ncbi:TonB-dependent receptor [Paludibacter propionicigenes WB4]|uniref:TonB-dependent receptor n=1 Tax=Paludibacter propionicigenes (strain DSM 17365 / JCM 13257 / WB4) TaxID=694427 RepID=E4T369_PALPW|nr:TonB-dependent receptor [Paludibacter propionicigenes]ADQ79163.1 TonB-dependent receptor [Paludibacter propionicigenes WB4]
MIKKLFLLLFLCGSMTVLAQPGVTEKEVSDTIKLKDVLVSVSLPLNNKDIVDFYRTNQFSTLDNITARLDGLSLIKRGAYALEPQVNGFSGGQLNLTIDGMRMFGACTDKMDPITSYIEPTNLKSINVKQGTGSCQTGCNIGGSVDFSLSEPTEGLGQHFLSVAFGHESISRGNNILFSMGLGKDKWNWLIDGVYRKNENYRDGNNREILFSQFEKINLHTAMKYKVDEVNSLKLDVLYDLAQHVGYPALPMDVSKARATLFALEYQRKTNMPLKAKLYYNEVLHIMDDSQRDSLYLLKNKPVGKSDSVYMRMDMPGKSSTLGAYVQLDIPWNEKNNLTVKADNYSNKSIAEMTMHMRYAGFSPEPPMYMQTWPAMLRNVSGLFLENSTYLSDRLTLLLNGRVDYTIDNLQSEYGQQQFSVFNYSISDTQSKLVKSLNLSAQYRISTGISIMASTGYAERMPTIGERLGFYLYNAYDGYDYIGNPYIKPEKSNFFRLNFQLSKPTIKLNFNQSFSFLHDYIMGITNTQIAAMNFYAKGIRVYSNVPDAKLYSADLQVLYSPIASWSFFLLSKLTVGEIQNGKPMPLISPLKNVLAVQYEKDNLMIQAECESALAQNRINSDYGEHVTPAYTVWNVKGGYKFNISEMQLDAGLGVTNLLNKVYYEHLDWSRINRPGRSLELYVKFSY